MREQAVRWLLPLYIIVLVCGLCLSIFFFYQLNLTFCLCSF